MQAPTRSGRKRKLSERVAAAIEDEAASREEKRLANTARLARARDEALRRAEKAAKKARDDDARHKVEVVKAWRGVMQQLVSQPTELTRDVYAYLAGWGLHRLKQRDTPAHRDAVKALIAPGAAAPASSSTAAAAPPPAPPSASAGVSSRRWRTAGRSSSSGTGERARGGRVVGRAIFLRRALVGAGSGLWPEARTE